MDFDFLPKLPNSDLDDRKYEDLVKECLARIPRYCPEWTHYNPSDPGITLIELFAWLTDQMQLRFNQVPRRNYVAFLELLGLRLQPAKPARTDLTFYLSSAQPDPVYIPRGTEVATERSGNEPAVIFSTERPLVIGIPRIKYFLQSSTSPEGPLESSSLQNPFLEQRQPSATWRDLNKVFLFLNSQLENCFYLVLDTEPGQSIRGNVVEVSFSGEAATGVGIDPNDPPREWQFWNGQAWEAGILRREQDDRTKGFNFAGVTEQSDGLPTASVRLYLPRSLRKAQFGNYWGYWIRCVYRQINPYAPGYSASPRIEALTIKSVGGTVSASECLQVQDEILGTSNGKPGQSFQLQMAPVLQRRPAECILVRPIGEPTQRWQEVADFSESDQTSQHYTIDSLTGTVQFGPLIRESTTLRQAAQDRFQRQTPLLGLENHLLRENNGYNGSQGRHHHLSSREQVFDRRERQYGQVPPAGAEIVMKSYRFGGGERGNVQADKLTVLRAAIPYVTRVTNHQPAIGGDNAESLEQAVLRVPQLLRNSACAVTPDQFEKVVKSASSQVFRAHCLTDPQYNTAGVVRILVVPRPRRPISWPANQFPDVPAGVWLNSDQGIHPDCFQLEPKLISDIQKVLNDRKPLGIHVRLEVPDYVGVRVQMRVILERNGRAAEAQEQIRRQIQAMLYRFLSPIEGGLDRQGWELGRSVYASDIVLLCQKIPGILHVGDVTLFQVRQIEGVWGLEAPATDSQIQISPRSLLCSWSGPIERRENHAHPTADFGHEIIFN